jgi:ssDNA-binding Zn-finger/Zn-ribbon topoisomerase 1
MAKAKSEDCNTDVIQKDDKNITNEDTWVLECPKCHRRVDWTFGKKEGVFFCCSQLFQIEDCLTRGVIRSRAANISFRPFDDDTPEPCLEHEQKTEDYECASCGFKARFIIGQYPEYCPACGEAWRT